MPLGAIFGHSSLFVCAHGDNDRYDKQIFVVVCMDDSVDFMGCLCKNYL